MESNKPFDPNFKVEYETKKFVIGKIPNRYLGNQKKQQSQYIPVSEASRSFDLNLNTGPAKKVKITRIVNEDDSSSKNTIFESCQSSEQKLSNSS